MRVGLSRRHSAPAVPASRLGASFCHGRQGLKGQTVSPSHCHAGTVDLISSYISATSSPVPSPILSSTSFPSLWATSAVRPTWALSGSEARTDFGTLNHTISLHHRTSCPRFSRIQSDDRSPTTLKTPPTTVDSLFCLDSLHSLCRPQIRTNHVACEMVEEGMRNDLVIRRALFNLLFRMASHGGQTVSYCL